MSDVRGESGEEVEDGEEAGAPTSMSDVGSCPPEMSDVEDDGWCAAVVVAGAGRAICGCAASLSGSSMPRGAKVSLTSCMMGVRGLARGDECGAAAAPT